MSHSDEPVNPSGSPSLSILNCEYPFEDHHRSSSPDAYLDCILRAIKEASACETPPNSPPHGELIAETLPAYLNTLYLFRWHAIEIVVQARLRLGYAGPWVFLKSAHGASLEIAGALLNNRHGALAENRLNCLDLLNRMDTRKYRESVAGACRRAALKIGTCWRNGKTNVTHTQFLFY